MVNIEQLFQRLMLEGKREISSFELCLIVKELSYGHHTKFDEYLDDWISGKVELERAKATQEKQPPKQSYPKEWDDIFLIKGH